MSVSVADVQAIINTSLTDGQITAFITTAQVIFDNSAGSAGYDATTEDEIVKWLAAHLLSCRDQRSKSESIGDVSKSYQGTTAMGLDATTYGQMVKLLDTVGALTNLGKVKAFVQVGYDVPDADRVIL